MTTHDPVRFVAKNMRVDLRLIAGMIAPGTRVLDIGCGDGTLIDHLFHTKGCDARGIEIDMAEVTRAVAHGLPVMHGDADTDLQHYPDGGFDYVVLSRTLQAVERPRIVLRQMLRIGTRAVVSFPNFGHWLVRWQLFSRGRMPMTPTWDRPVVRDAEHPSLHHPRLLRPVRAGGLRGGTMARRRRRGPPRSLAALPLARQPVRRARTVRASAGVSRGACANRGKATPLRLREGGSRHDQRRQYTPLPRPPPSSGGGVPCSFLSVFPADPHAPCPAS